MTFFGKCENVEELHSECEARFSQCVQKDFNHGFAQPYRFCHVKWVLLRGKTYTAERGNLFGARTGAGRHLENRNSFGYTFWSFKRYRENLNIYF